MKLNLIVPINRTGYGIAGLGYALGLKSLLGKDLSIIPISEVDSQMWELSNSAHILENVNKDPDWTNPTVCFWHLSDLDAQMSQAKGLRIGLTTFEIDTFTPAEKAVVDTLDAIGTATDWGVKILHSHFPGKPIFQAGHSLKTLVTDTTSTIKNDNPVPIWSSILAPIRLPDDTLVLTSAGKYEARKGHLALLDACCEAANKTNILLVGFWHNRFIHNNYPFKELIARNFYREATDTGIKLYSKMFGNNQLFVALMPPTRNRIELHGALARAHAFISPSVAEGWDLPLFEMMSYGMPCAATLVSGHSQYCRQDNVIPINVGPPVPAIDPPFFDGLGKWHNHDHKSITDTILNINNLRTLHPEALTVIGNTAREDLAKSSWQEEAKRILQVVHNLKSSMMKSTTSE